MTGDVILYYRAWDPILRLWFYTEGIIVPNDIDAIYTLQDLKDCFVIYLQQFGKQFQTHLLIDGVTFTFDFRYQGVSFYQRNTEEYRGIVFSKASHTSSVVRTARQTMDLFPNCNPYEEFKLCT